MILVIYCYGGHGKEILLLANMINAAYHRWNEIIFADDNINISFPIHNKVLTFEQIKEKYDKSNCEFVIASGEPYLLRALSKKVIDNDYNLTHLIASNVRIDSDLHVKHGCVVQESTVITCNVSLGASTCVGVSAVLHHDVKIGDYCFVAANCTICGNVVIGDGTFIGAGSVIRDEVKIGSNCVIGMGSVVVKDVPDNSVLYGNPARIVRHKTEQMIFK